jgi:hypothetical protein
MTNVRRYSFHACYGAVTAQRTVPTNFGFRAKIFYAPVLKPLADRVVTPPALEIFAFTPWQGSSCPLGWHRRWWGRSG